MNSDTYPMGQEPMPLMTPEMGLESPTSDVLPSAEPQVEEIVLDRSAMLSELLNWSVNFQKKSAEWRKANFEENWDRWQRAKDAIYDPVISAKKEAWQSKAVWPITAAHCETAQAQLFRTEVGPRPPLEVKSRKGLVPLGPDGQPMDQAEIIRDLTIREREKGQYEVERNKQIEDKITYGSGFMRARFETRIEDRVIKVPELEPMSIMDPTSIMRHMSGQAKVIGYKDEVQPVTIYRGVKYEYIPIRDVFWDPLATKVEGSPIAVRYRTTYGEILKGIEEGYYLPEAAEKLRSESSKETTPEDKQGVQADREQSDTPIERTEHQRVLECFEVEARIPKKWVLIDGQEIDDPEKLMPAVIRFHEKAVVAVKPSESYDGEPTIYKDDYIPIAGSFIGRGIPEMLKDVQLVSSETINQRLDTGSVALRQKFAVIERSIVDPKDLEEDRNVIRIKAPSGVNDIRQMFMTLDMGKVDSAAFIEPQEWERVGQERTSVTRLTMGTAGQVKDANQTLGGMEMLKSASGDKLAFIGMLSEFDFQYKITRATWRLIYTNYQPEDYAMALGPQRAQTFLPMSPEELELSYAFVPMGVYQMENKAMRQARLAQWYQQFGMMPWANAVQVAKTELQSMDEDPELFIHPEAVAMEIMGKAQQMAVNQVNQMMQPQEAPGGQGTSGKA